MLLIAGLAATAQDPAEEVPAAGGGFLVNLLENQISAPGREIGVSGLSGVLSSQARIERVTVSDDQGVWMVIDDVEIDWSRAQLFLARVQVNRLHVGQITWLRRGIPPEPEPGLPTPEAQPFTVPELPVSVRLEDIELERLVFDEQVFGMAAELSGGGSLVLADGSLDADIAVTRLDGPGGELALDAAFSNATRLLDIDLHLQEPEGGVVATLLGIEGTPAIDLRVAGAGPLENVDVELTLDADGARLAGGTVALRGTDEGLGFDAALSGGIAPLVPPEFRDFFAGETAVEVRGINVAAGGMRLDRLDVSSGALTLGGRLETGPDGFLRSLDLVGQLGDPADPPVRLPLPGPVTRLTSATLRVEFGASSTWSGFVVLDRLEAGGIEIEDVTLTMGGRARNLEDPAERDVTIALEGLATGVWSPDPAVAAAMGTRLDLFADLGLEPGGTIDVRQFQFGGNGLSVFTAGRFAQGELAGRGSVRIADLAVVEGFAGRRLSGGIALQAQGSVTPLDGAFDLTFDGHASDLVLGDPRLDGLFDGETTLAGRAVRDETGFRTENLRLSNPQLSFTSDGRIASDQADFGFDAQLNDLALIDPRVSGAIAARGQARGEGGPLDLSLAATIGEGSLTGRPIRDFALGFDGRLDGDDLAGRLTGGGAFAGLDLDLGAGIEVSGPRRAVSDLRLAVGPTVLTGALSQTRSDPVVGQLTLDAPDIAPLAALALIEATGGVQAEISLAASDPGQGVGVSGRADELALGGSRMGSLDFDLTVVDALGQPLIGGSAQGSDIVVAGFEIATLDVQAEQVDPARMRVTAGSRLAIGTEVETDAELEWLPGGFAATLQTLTLTQEGLSAALTAPATVTMANGAVTLTPLALDVGGGRLTAAGSVADELDLDLQLTDVPLELADALRPGLGLTGTLAGTARVTGPRAAPEVSFELAGSEITSAATAAAGLPPFAVAATGRTAAERLELEGSVTAPGIAARAQGSVALGPGVMDIAVGLDSFPLEPFDQLAGELGLAGNVTGDARLSGTYADPHVSFEVRGSGIAIDLLRDRGLPALDLSADGAFRGGVITLDRAVASGAGLALQLAGNATPAAGAFDLTFDGRATDLALGEELLDGLFAGETTLAGRAMRANGELRVENLRLANPQLTVAADGSLADMAGDMHVEARLADLGLLDPRASGALALEARASGSVAAFDASLTASIAEGVLMDRPIRDLAVGFEGSFADGDLVGTLTGGGSFDGVPLELGAGIAASLERRELSDLRLAVGPNLLTGGLAQTGSAPVTGTLVLDAPDITPLAALALMEASGALQATLRLDASEPEGQGAHLAGRADGLVLGANRVGALDFDVTLADALDQPLVSGSAQGSDIVVAGIEFATLGVEAEQLDPGRMRMSADGRLAAGTELQALAEVERRPGGFAATLQTLSLDQAGRGAELVAPATVTVEAGTVTLTPLALDLDGGRLTAEGSIGEAFDLSLELAEVPLAVADTLAPGLGLGGTVSGSAQVTGPRAEPDVSFTIDGSGITSTATTAAGLPPLALAATGRTVAGRVTLDATVTAPGIAASAQGSLPLGPGVMDLALALEAFPLALLDGVAGNLGLDGDLTGTARVSGTFADPHVDFDVRGSGIGIDLLREYGLPPIDASGEGNFQGGTLNLDALEASAPGLLLRARGSATPGEGAFDMTFDGSATDFAIGIPQVDRLLAGETMLAGRAVRDAAGFRTENLRLSNPQFSVVSEGQIAATGADFGFEAELADLAVLEPRARGALAASGRVAGADGLFDLDLSAGVAEGSLLDRPISDVTLDFEGRLAGRDLAGQVTGGGLVDALELDLDAGIEVSATRRAVSGLRLALGPNLLTGALSQTGSGPFVGELVLDAPDIEALAALALVEATGALRASIALSDSDPGQGVALSGRAEELTVGPNRVGSLVFDLSVTDALGLPLIGGWMQGSDIGVAGFEIATLGVEAEQVDPTRMRVSVESTLAIGTEITTAGELERLPGGFAATLETLRLDQGDLHAELMAPSTVTLVNGAITLTPLSLDLGEGQLTAAGTFADEIDITVDIADVPLELANTLRPELGLGGTIAGTARVTGPRASPDVRYELAGAEVTSPQTLVAGLPPLTIAASGQTVGGRISVDASVTSSGVAAIVEGTIPAGAGEMDLRVTLQSFPLALADRLAGNLGLAGSLTGSAQVSGPFADPLIAFQAEATALSLAFLRENGLPLLNLAAEGNFQRGVVTLASAQAGGAPGLALTASGTIPLQGPGLDLRLSGTVPVNLADSLLVGRLAQASGALQVDATVTGALASPQFSGNLALAGGTFVDPATNIRLDNIRLDAGLSGTTLQVRDFAATVGGGTATAAGTLEIAPALGFPAALTIQISNVRYTDGAMVTTTIDGDLALNGPVLGGGVLSGRIDLGPTEISIAEGFGYTAQAALDQVRHVRPPPRVAETLRRAAVGAPAPRQAGQGVLQLDLRITAPNQIFVRGRGLDAEVGGELRVTGPTDDLQPVGQFDLRRGRIDLIGQRIEFEEGSVQLVGDLDPRLNFVARTRSGDITAIVTVSGRASEPDITFSSDPPLPEDEVLSHVLFNRATQNLSPFQAAQLAAAAAELAGQGGNGLLSQIRQSLGFDDFDIIMDEEGQAAVRAGRYLGEDVYVDVQTGANGDSRIELTYEINERVTARGSVATDGNTTLGIFYERDF